MSLVVYFISVSLSFWLLIEVVLTLVSILVMFFPFVVSFLFIVLSVVLLVETSLTLTLFLPCLAFLVAFVTLLVSILGSLTGEMNFDRVLASGVRTLGLQVKCYYIVFRSFQIYWVLTQLADG